MSTAIATYNSLETLAADFRTTLTPTNGSAGKNCILLYAYNGSGKTRLSMDFRQGGKKYDEDENVIERDTLYFNAFTEDLFFWDNDLDNDTERVMLLNNQSQFFNGIQEQDMENKIRPFVHRYANFNFLIDYNYQKKNASGEREGQEYWAVNFIREEIIDGTAQNIEYIKISRGEENIFIWSFFMAIAQLAIDQQVGYEWVQYIYIDDPISSLDDNNTIALANDLTQLLKREGNSIKTIISTHHILFFNILCNDLKKVKHMQYFLHKKASTTYALRETRDTPFFHHVATLSELKNAVDLDKVKTYHFNTLRSILEKTSSFFGYNDFGKCIHGVNDKVLYERALNLLSHGKYSVYEPVDMVDDTKDLFKRILTEFLEKYKFDLPVIFNPEIVSVGDDTFAPSEEEIEDGGENEEIITKITTPIIETTAPIQQTADIIGEATGLGEEEEETNLESTELIEEVAELVLQPSELVEETTMPLEGVLVQVGEESEPFSETTESQEEKISEGQLPNSIEKDQKQNET